MARRHHGIRRAGVQSTWVKARTTIILTILTIRSPVRLIHHCVPTLYSLQLVSTAYECVVQPVPAQQTRVSTWLAFTAALLLTVGTGKAGLPHRYAQRGRRRGGPERRGCPQSPTRGARGMDVPCIHTHTYTHQRARQTQRLTSSPHAHSLTRTLKLGGRAEVSGWWAEMARNGSSRAKCMLCPHPQPPPPNPLAVQCVSVCACCMENTTDLMDSQN